MKVVHYTADAVRDLKRHGNMAARIRRAIAEYAETGAHANNVTLLVGSPLSRMRVSDFRVIFADGQAEIQVLKIRPRGDVYD